MLIMGREEGDEEKVSWSFYVCIRLGELVDWFGMIHTVYGVWEGR